MNIPVRFIKILRDLRFSYGRVAVMALAIAVAVTGFGAIITAKEIISADSTAAYFATNPAAATIDVAGGVDDALVNRVQALEGVADAAARQIVSTRVLVSNEWMPITLFVYAPSDPLRVARFEVDSGTWPTRPDGLLLERAAVSLLGSADSLQIANAEGDPIVLEVSGVAYDPSLPPATQERTGYAFVTPAAIERLGFDVVADQLKITVEDPITSEPTRDQAAVDARATTVAQWLVTEGNEVHGVSAPPYRHPHQNQTDTITNLLLAFAIAALILAGVLVASTLGAMLAGQTRQIGVMKTVGGRTRTIASLYLGMVMIIAIAATTVALGLGVWLGVALADLVGGLLNIEMETRSASPWAIALIVAAGIGIPTLVALSPVLKAARVTVREALSDRDIEQRTGSRRVDLLLSRAGGGDRVPVFAARNLLRRPQRFIATVALLAAGGALFLAGINSASAWQRWVDDGLSKRTYDAQLGFAAPETLDAIGGVVNGVSGVSDWESVLTLHAVPSDGSEAAIQRVYPDGGHGTFSVTSIDPDTELIQFDVRDGTWLQPGDGGTAVLNQAAAARLGDPELGSSVTVWIEGTLREWTVTGFVDEVGGAATLYVATGELDSVLGKSGMATGVRIVAPSDTAATIAQTEAALSAAGLAVVSTVPTTELESAIDQHVLVFIAVLISLAILMAVIGLLGLASATSINVLERTREHGIMKAIGARGATIRWLVVSEAVITGIAGLALAVIVSIPVTAVVGNVLGRLTFDLPLPLVISGTAIMAWSVLAIAGAVVAALSAAMRAAGLTVRESLAAQ